MCTDGEILKLGLWEMVELVREESGSIGVGVVILGKFV